MFAHDSILAHRNQDGAARGAPAEVEVDAHVRASHDPSHDVAIGVELLAALEDRGRELAADAGHDHAAFDTAADRQDERTRHWLSARGFAVATTFTRMRIDFDGPRCRSRPRK